MRKKQPACSPRKISRLAAHAAGIRARRRKNAQCNGTKPVVGSKGYHCRFCGIPVIRAEVRRHFTKLYPQLRIWGRTNQDQHAALQAMWVQYDHIVPHAASGTNELNNMVITCAPCNDGRMHYRLIDVALSDPRLRAPVVSAWDGLEPFLLAKKLGNSY